MPLSDPAVTGVNPTVIVVMTIKIARSSEIFRLIIEVSFRFAEFFSFVQVRDALRQSYCSSFIK